MRHKLTPLLMFLALSPALIAMACVPGEPPAPTVPASVLEPSRPPWLRIYTDIDFRGPSLGLISGWHGTILRSTNAGQAWSEVQTPSDADLNSVAILDANNAVAVGSSGNILRSSDGGQSWAKVESPTSETLNSVAAVNINSAVAVGVHGTIIGTNDGGKTWTSRYSSTDPSLNFEAVAFTPTGAGMAVSSGGVCLRTADTISWRPVTLPDGGQKLFAVDLFDDNNIMLAGSVRADATTVAGGKTVILKTESGGKNWGHASSNLNVDLLTIKYIDRQSVLAAGWDGIILRTQDGGGSWTSVVSQTNEAIRALAVLDSNTIFAVGDGQTIVESRNGGLTWEKIRGS